MSTPKQPTTKEGEVDLRDIPHSINEPPGSQVQPPPVAPEVDPPPTTRKKEEDEDERNKKRK